MKMKYRVAGVVAVLVSCCATSFALTLAEKKALSEWQKYLTDPEQSSVKTVQQKCGIEIPVALDEGMVTPFLAENASAASYCDAARSKIASMCDDAVAKPEIVAKVKSISCKPGEKEKLALSLNEGVLTLTVGVGAANIEDEVGKFLETHL